MIDILSLIEPPGSVVDLRKTPEGRHMLTMFDEIDHAYPEFFGALASMGGVGFPISEGDGRDSSDFVNEGKRLFALEILAVLKVAKMPAEKDDDE